jgi:hypothetical protein
MRCRKLETGNSLSSFRIVDIKAAGRIVGKILHL